MSSRLEYERDATNYIIAAGGIARGDMEVGELSSDVQREINALQSGLVLKSYEGEGSQRTAKAMQARNECLEVLVAVVDPNSCYSEKWALSKIPPRKMCKKLFEKIRTYLVERSPLHWLPETPKSRPITSRGGMTYPWRQ